MATQPYARAAIRRLLFASALASVLVLAVLAAAAASHPSGYPITIEVRTTATGDHALPYNFAVQPGHVIELRIRNFTRELHTFAIPAIGLNVAVLPGRAGAPRTTEVTFVLPRYGIYKWLCWTCRSGLHVHRQMGGKMYAWIAPDASIG